MIPDKCLKISNGLKQELFRFVYSFHVGTGSETPSTYHKAITFSRELFDAAESFGFNFNILDIGGGFPGVPLTTGKFQKVCSSFSQSCRKGRNYDWAITLH